MQKARVSLIVAMGKNRLIGKKNGLLWHIPDDLSRFRKLTMGHPVIMGRKTFESILAILKKPLPGRTSVVITRDPQWHYEGAVIAHSLEEAFTKARELDNEEIFIIGGAQIYEQVLTYIDRIYLTLIDDEKEGDAYFPEYEGLFTKIMAHEDREHNGLKYKWVDFEK